MDDDDCGQCPAGLPEWLATFADLMSLLLCFFVLIVSFSSMQQVEFQKAMGSLKGALGILKSKRAIIHLQAQPTTPIQYRKLSMIWEKLEELEQMAELHGFKGAVKYEAMDNAIKFTLQDQVVFESGQSRVLPKSMPILRKIAEMNLEAKGTMRIDGHTDNVPIRTTRFPSNWELSSSRAINVLHYFENLGIKRDRLSCIGFADTKPIAPNDTPENRQKNRRVEILLQMDDYSNPFAPKMGQQKDESEIKFIVPEQQEQTEPQGQNNKG